MNYGPIVTLPVGIRPSSGGVFREVHLDQMRAKDQELLADKKLRGNGAMAMSMILRRCIQAIPGYLPAKDNKTALIDASIVRAMTQCDRDYLIAAIRALEGKTETTFVAQCPACGNKDTHVLNIADIPEFTWGDDEALVLPPLELPNGLVNKSGVACRKITFRLATGADSESLAAQPDGKRLATLVAATCVDLEGYGKLDSEAVAGLLLSDMEAISDHMSQHLPGLDLVHRDTCDNCGAEVEHGVDLSSFLSPKKAKTSTSGVKRQLRS